MNKYTFIDNKLRHTPYNHAYHIKGNYDEAIRLIIFDKPKLIYIRINDFSIYQGIEYKRVTYRFKDNLRACGLYLKNNFRGFKVFDSYSIVKLPYNIQRDILDS